MNKVVSGLFLAILFVQSPSLGSIHNNGVHTVESLAQICLEAEHDARDGAEEEALCEQYLSGFAEALLLILPGKYSLYF